MNSISNKKLLPIKQFNEQQLAWSWQTVTVFNRQSKTEHEYA